MHKNKTVTIFLPTLNEIEGLKVMIPRIKKSWYTDLIVVDGGSTDGTLQYLKKQNINIIIMEKMMERRKRLMIMVKMLKRRKRVIIMGKMWKRRI